MLDLEQRQKLGVLFADLLDLSEMQQGDELRDKWDKLERWMREEVVPLGREPWEGAGFVHVPFITPRMRKRRAFMVETLTGQKPMFNIRMRGSLESAKDKEELLDAAFEMAGFRSKLRKATWKTLWTNKGIWRLRPKGLFEEDKPGEEGPLRFDIIHPRHFFIYPATDRGVEGAKLVGHRFVRRLQEIKERQASGEYFGDVSVSGGDRWINGTDREIEGDLESTLDHLDEPVECAEFLVKHIIEGYEDEHSTRRKRNKQRESWYLVTLARRDQAILRIEPYIYSRPWYFVQEIYDEDDVFWSHASPASDLEPMQIEANQARSMANWGMQYSAFPGGLVQGNSDDWDGRIGPGEYRQVRDVAQTIQLKGQFDGSVIPFIVQDCDRRADQVSSVPESVSGGEAYNIQTATEQNIKWKGLQAGVSDDIDAASPCLTGMACFALELLREHPEWMREYPHMLKPQDLSYRGGYTIDIAGKTPSDAPTAQAQEAQNLIQFLSATMPLLNGANLTVVIWKLLRSLVASSNLKGKEDLLKELDAMQQQQQLMQQQQALQALLAQENLGQNPTQTIPLVPAMGGDPRGALQGAGVPGGQAVEPGAVGLPPA